MIKKCKGYFIIGVVLLSIQMLLCISILPLLPFLKGPDTITTSAIVGQATVNSPDEERGYPTYDKIIGNDGWPHYRVFFWVSKTATNFIPYSDAGIKTDVSSHGPVEKWSVVETKTIDGDKKLVYIFVPKTFVYLYGNGFEKVIHLQYF